MAKVFQNERQKTIVRLMESIRGRYNKSVVTIEDLKEATCSECGKTGLCVCTEEDE